MNPFLLMYIPSCTAHPASSVFPKFFLLSLSAWKSFLYLLSSYWSINFFITRITAIHFHMVYKYPTSIHEGQELKVCKTQFKTFLAYPLCSVHLVCSDFVLFFSISDSFIFY